MTHITLVLGEKSQSVSGNYTDVSWSLKLFVTYAVNANMTGSVVINGTTVHNYSSNPGGIYANATKTIASGTHRVHHNSDGTKSFNWSANLRTNTQGRSWSFSESTSGSRTLSRIPRASGASLSSNTVQMGGSVNIGFARASSSFTHSVRLSFGSYVNEAITRTSATSFKLDIPSASVLAKEIPNAASGSGSIRVTTFSGTTSLGYVTLPITLTVPSSVTPSVGTITISDTTNFHTLAGNFVQGRSKPRVDVSGSSGVYGSTIRSSVVTLGSRSLGSPGSTFTVPSAGTGNLSVTVTDSRGRTATKSFGNVTVLGYSAPVADVTAKRANSNNGENPYGTYLKFEGTTSVHDIAVNGVANKRTVSVTTAVSGSSSTTSLYSLTNSATRSGAIPSPLGSNAILVVNPYDVVVTVTDSLGVSTVKRISIPSGQVSLSVGKLGIGVGKVWERGALDVDGDVHIEGGITVGGRSYTEAEVRDALGTRDNTIMIDGVAYERSGVQSLPSFTWAWNSTTNVYATTVEMPFPYIPPDGWTFRYTMGVTTGFSFANSVGVANKSLRQTSVRMLQLGSNSTTAIKSLMWILVKV